MNVKYSILPVVAALFFFAVSSVQAQDIKIGLVDMQEALNKFNETQRRTDDINARAQVLQKAGEDRGKKLKVIEDKIKAETAIVQDTEKNDSTREAAAKAREALLGEFRAEQQEAMKAGQKAAEELAKARKDMEVDLVKKITTVMEDLSKSKGVDLVFDKSFLPRANKAIIYTSSNVLDMTSEIIDIINK